MAAAIGMVVLLFPDVWNVLLATGIREESHKLMLSQVMLDLFE